MRGEDSAGGAARGGRCAGDRAPGAKGRAAVVTLERLCVQVVGTRAPARPSSSSPSSSLRLHRPRLQLLLLYASLSPPPSSTSLASLHPLLVFLSPPPPRLPPSRASIVPGFSSSSSLQLSPAAMAEASCAGAPPIKRLLDQQARYPGPVHDRLQHASGSLSLRPQAGPALRGPDPFASFAHAAPSARRLNLHLAGLQQPSLPDRGLTNPLLSPARSSPPSASRTQEPSVPSWALEFGRFEAAHDTVVTPRQLDRLPVQLPALPPLHAASPPSALTPTSFRGPVPFSAPSLANLGPSIEPDFASDLARWMSSHGAQDMAPVDAALESFARQLELNEAPVSAAAAATTEATACPPSSTSRLSDLDGPELENLPPLAATSPPPDLASHRLDEAPPRPQTPDQASPTSAPPRSAVAEVASRLLEAVDHEDGQKWQQSTFLSLMRDFKHGRKDIVDNQICSMGDHELTTAAAETSQPLERHEA